MNTVDIELQLPSYVTDMIDRFYGVGETAYIVGGSLRDIMLGRVPHDFDITTSALPEKTMELFSDMRVIATGLKHGTVTVISEGEPVEITTFRVDGSYTDSRHPDSVRFTPNIEEDLSRRDFTVNAMAYSPRDGIVDPFLGREDLDRGVLRAVGEPERRFTEDALRIMRAFRFSAQLDFSIDRATISGIVATRGGLNNIARERVASELLRLLTTKAPSSALCAMIGAGVMPYVTGGYAPNEKIIGSLSLMPATDTARLGFFLCGADEDEARDILHSLKYSNKQITGALAVRRGSRIRVESGADARRFIAAHGVYAAEAVRASVLLGNSPESAVALVEGSHAPCKISELAISGRELIALGISGKAVGETLERLLEAVIEDPSLNCRDTLLSMAEDLSDKR